MLWPKTEGRSWFPCKWSYSWRGSGPGISNDSKFKAHPRKIKLEMSISYKMKRVERDQNRLFKIFKWETKLLAWFWMLQGPSFWIRNIHFTKSSNTLYHTATHYNTVPHYVRTVPFKMETGLFLVRRNVCILPVGLRTPFSSKTLHVPKKSIPQRVEENLAREDLKRVEENFI